MPKIAAGISQVVGLAAGVLQFIPGGQPFAAAAQAIAIGAGAISALTAKPPIPVPALDDFTLGAEQPYPYAMGRMKLPGHLVHVEAHGRERQDVPNPWLTQTFVLTGAGPVEAIDTLLANSNPVTFNVFENGYYDKYLRGDTSLGTIPGTSLNTFRGDGAPPTFRYWNSSRIISGMAAMQFSMLLDDKETHFRSGPPDFAAVGRWVKAYDARLDDTVEGGTGPHRIDDETTFTYHNNGPMHGLTYAYGRYQNGQLVCGGGLPISAIDVESFIEAANVATANNWTVNGIVYENGEDGEIWNNLKLILETAAAWPTNDGGKLRCMQQRPRVALDTITEEDLEGPYSLPGMQPIDRGINTTIPKYMSEANDWTMVASTAVEVPSLRAAQGEPRSREHVFSLVTDANQAAALGVLRVYDSVEIDPIVLVVGRRFISYEVGDAMQLTIPELNLNHLAVIHRHEVDVTTGRVTLQLVTDTAAKHPYALSRTGTAPDHPALESNEDLDLASGAIMTTALRPQAISTSHIADMATEITATREGDGYRISIPAHNRVYGNPAQFPKVAVEADTVDVTENFTEYYLYYDDADMLGGDIEILVTKDGREAVTSDTNPFRHFVGWIRTPRDSDTDPTTGVHATPPNEPPSVVPDAGSLGGVDADEYKSLLTPLSVDAIRQAGGIDAFTGDGGALTGLVDSLRSTIAAQRDQASENNFDFADRGTGWIFTGSGQAFVPGTNYRPALSTEERMAAAEGVKLLLEYAGLIGNG